MAKTHNGIAADLVVPMGSKFDADVLRHKRIGRNEGNGDGNKLEFFRVVTADCGVQIIIRELFEVLKFHGPAPDRLSLVVLLFYLTGEIETGQGCASRLQTAAVMPGVGEGMVRDFLDGLDGSWYL